MRQSGKVNFLVVAVAAIAVIGGTLAVVMGGDSPTTVTNKFMVALATGDVDTLTEVSYMPDSSEEETRAAWDRTVNVVAPYYRFRWKTLSQSRADEKTASVDLWVWRDAMSPSTYEEKFGIPLVKEGRTWKVDVRGVPREMFPGLPR